MQRQGHPFLGAPSPREEAGWGGPGCPKLPAGAAVLFLGQGRGGGTGSSCIIGSRRELGGVAASSSVPALATRQGFLLNGIFFPNAVIIAIQILITQSR